MTNKSPKSGFCIVLITFESRFLSLWGWPEKVTFESLFRSFFFWVSGLLARAPHHKPTGWWFGVLRVPGFPAHLQSAVSAKNNARMLRHPDQNYAWRLPQSICRTEWTPGPEKHQIRNVQILDVVVIEKSSAARKFSLIVLRHFDNLWWPDLLSLPSWLPLLFSFAKQSSLPFWVSICSSLDS